MLKYPRGIMHWKMVGTCRAQSAMLLCRPQLPTCFRYREREENGPRVRVHLSGRGVSDRQLSSAVPARADRIGETGSSSYIARSSDQVQSNALDFLHCLEHLKGDAVDPKGMQGKQTPIIQQVMVHPLEVQRLMVCCLFQLLIISLVLPSGLDPNPNIWWDRFFQ